MTKVLTPFEQAKAAVAAGTLNTPSVSVGAKNIDYISYQLATHKFNLSIMAGGMKFKGVKFTDLKKYYGLKGRSAKDCIEEFKQIIANYEMERAT
jgi:hypothetical protein